LKWRDVDPTKECFLIDELPPAEAWATLNLRSSDSSLFSIFQKFVNGHIVERLIADFERLDLSLGKQKNSGSGRRIVIDKRKVWQTLAVYTYLTGKQNTTKESVKNGRFMRNNIQEARKYFKSNHDAEPIGRESIEKLIGNMLLSIDYSDDISSNFVSALATLGQNVAGDEKLWRFTDNSANIRLVPSKPGKIGLWFYELCCRLQAGDAEIPFLMYVRMHDSVEKRVTVDEIVRLWVVSTCSVGAASAAVGMNPNPRCYLIFDSYYESSSTRNYLLQKGQYFSGSCKPDRVKMEYERIHNDGVADIPGQSKTICKDETNEVFTFHYDRQKGVGKKYYLSYGFIHSTLKLKVKAHENFIPGCTHYKTMFEICDNFNRRLHDCQGIWGARWKGTTRRFGESLRFYYGIFIPEYS
jgi:hypothetical protein